jgi:signal transduction histidine kinase/CheY-like chemotaxis protein
VTARRQAEERLRASERRYRTLVTAIDQGFCVIEVQFADGRATDYRFLEANPVFEHQTGLADPVGRTIRELAPDIEERWFEIYGRVVATGEATRFVEGSAALGRWFDVFASRVGGPGSRTVAILFSDVTERRRAEAERERLLREIETERGRLADVFQHAPSFMCVLRGPDHVFERVNERYSALVSGRRLIGRPLRDALPEVAGQGFVELLDRVYRTGEAFVGAGARVVLEPGGGRPPEERFLDFVYQPLRDADGRVTGILVQGVDLTDRKRAEDALKEADRKKDDFIALLAHELRNPLAPIRNGLQTLRLSPEPATRERSQAIMDRQLAHMVRMIDDLLDVSRIGRNKMTLRRARVTLAEVVGSAVETARPVIEEAGHELTVTLPPRPVLLDADLTRLAQVFANLLTNSAKYTERGGAIRLTADAADGAVSVAVRDTGIGIPADALPTLFEMFSQVEHSIERSKGGLGIGLALVKGLVEMHRGTVSAASAGAGRGSTFTVTLPALPADAAEPDRAVPDGPAAGPGRRLLVVDDNRDGAESLAAVLQLMGNEVATAHDGVEAVERAEAFRPEVILMDIGMPRLNGLEATARIRARPWGTMTIVALTGWGQDADRERSRAAGCDGHLVKPVSASDLEALLAELSRPKPA